MERNKSDKTVVAGSGKSSIPQHSVGFVLHTVHILRQVPVVYFVWFHEKKGLVLRSMYQLVKICEIVFKQFSQYYVTELQEASKIVSKCRTYLINPFWAQAPESAS